MSKVIKASQVTGEYKINQNPKTLAFEKKEDNGPEKKQIDKKEFANSNQKKNIKPALLKKAKNEAEKIIREAEIEAEEIIQEAEAEKEKLLSEKEELYQSIKTEAEAEGFEKGQDEVNKLKKELAEIISAFEKEISRKKDKIRKDVVELAVKIASIVIDVKLETEHDIINNIISDMLTKIDDNHRDIVVRVNPQLIPYIEENRFYQHINQKNIEFVSNPELRKGDCVVETNLGGKEGSLDHKLDLIKKELLKEVEQNA